jgi:hypothetical protein
MAKQAIDRGTFANDGTGDNLRNGASKINDNFDEVYTLLGDGTTLTSDDVVLRTTSQTLTTKTISGSSNTLTNIANSSLTNSGITVVDDSSTSATISLGETLAVIGGTGIDTAISGDSVSIAIDNTVTTNTGTQVLTNKTISGVNNTVSNIDNSSLTNSSFTIVDDSSTASTIALGETLAVIGGTGINTLVSGDSVSISLTNSSFTIVDDSSTASTISLGETLQFLGGTGITSIISGDTVTFAIDSTVVTESSTDTLINKTISGTSNTISNIGNSSLTNSGFTIVDDSSTSATISLGETLSITGGTGIDTLVSGDSVSIAIDNTIALKPTTTTATGDGSTVSFTLASAGTTDSVIVFVNGTFQVPVTDYTVSGTTLTFTSPPSGSAVIVIKEF